MLAERGEDVRVVAYEAAGALVVGVVLDGAPVQADVVEGVEHARGRQPVAVRGGAALAGARVEDRRGAAVGEQREGAVVDGEAPARTAPVQGEAARRLGKQALHELGRVAHHARRLVHVGAGRRQDAAPLGRVAAHAGGLQQPQRALVHLRLLVLGEDADAEFHQTASCASASARAMAASPASDDGLRGPPYRARKT